MLKYFWEKILLTVPACFFAFSQSQEDVLWGVILIVILDTILGMWVAFKYRIFSSHHLSRVFNKIGCYGIALASTWVLVAVAPEFTGTMRYTGIFIIITELFSNFEKLALLGFDMPGRILARINKQFMHFMEADGEEKRDVGENILKNRVAPKDDPIDKNKEK